MMTAQNMIDSWPAFVFRFSRLILFYLRGTGQCKRFPGNLSGNQRLSMKGLWVLKMGGSGKRKLADGYDMPPAIGKLRVSPLAAATRRGYPQPEENLATRLRCNLVLCRW